jgi:hypothetical protein
MSSKRLRYCAVLAALLATAGDGLAAGGKFTRGCAARDMQILMMLEQRESASAISAEELSDAFRTIMHARVVCHEGYVPEALAIYDKIARSLAPDHAFTSGMR